MADKLASQNVTSRRQVGLIVGGAMLIALVLSLAWFLFIHTPYAPAFTKLKTDDAALIVDELKKQKMPYQLADSGTTVKVPQDQVDAVRLAILGGGLPLKGTVGFELFNKSDMGLTEFAQKINYQRALQGELARTLMTLDNVESARVHITLPDDGVFRDDRRPAKASVTLAPKLGALIGTRTIIGIQRLVASAVEGLDAINVVVLDESGRQLSGDVPVPLPDMPNGAGQDPLELAWAEKVRRTIGTIVQDSQMRVLIVTPPDAAAMVGASPAPGAADKASASSAGARRAYPLQITVRLSREPEAGLKVRLQAQLQAQVGFGDNPGDSFDLIAQPGSSPFEVGQPVAIASGRVQPTLAEGAGVQVDLAQAGLIAIATAIALMLGMILLRRRKLTPLSAGEREVFAARLRNLLAERAENGRA